MGAKRQHRGITGLSGPIPELLPTNRRYFDVEALLEDVENEFGAAGSTIKGAAMFLGVPRETLKSLASNHDTSPNIETYARFCARLKRPFGSWLRLR